MAFKMKHKLTSVGLKQRSSTPLFNIDPVDRDKNKEEKLSDYEEINRSVTTRRGVQNDIPGTFTDTRITERADFDAEIPGATGGSRTEDTSQYIESLKKRFPGVPGSVLVEEGYIDPSFEDQFPLDYDQRDRLETSFVPDAVEESRPEYLAYESNFGDAMDFAGSHIRGTGRLIRGNEGENVARKVIKRSRYGANRGEQEANLGEQGLGVTQYQGGSSGMIDRDRNNFAAETASVIGITNIDDYKLGKNFGIGYINQDYKNAIALARERFKNHGDKNLLAQEKAKALEIANQQRRAANSRTFATPEMKQRFEQSHDTLYNRQRPTPPEFEGTRAQQAAQLRQWKGGGRTGKSKPGSITNIDTGYFNN
jgi:hypothetical protein